MLSERTKICSVLALKSLLLSQLTGRTRSSHPEWLYKKDVIKNFAKITEKHLCRGLFFNKDPSRGPAALLQRGSSTGFYVNSVKCLKTPILETSVNGCF